MLLLLKSRTPTAPVVVRTPTSWINDLNKQQAVWVGTTGGTTGVEVSYLYDDSTITYDSSTHYYDYLNILSNEINTNLPAIWRET